MPIGQKNPIGRRVIPLGSVGKEREYTDEFKELCFTVWYEAGKPGGVALLKILPKDENGIQPGVATFHGWKARFGWEERAREMDADVMKRVREMAIENKVKMFQRHAEAGKFLQERGLEYLMNSANSIDSAAVAMRLVTEGAKLEKVSTGSPQAMDQFAQMSDKSLKSVINKLLEGVSDDDLVAALPEEVIDGEISDVSD